MTWLLRRRTDIRIIYLLDNVIPHEKYPFGRFLTRLALRQGHGFIAQSDQVRQDLFDGAAGHRSRTRWSPRPIRSTISASPAGRARPRPRPGRPWACPPTARLVLFFGFIKPYKGVVHLIDAAPGSEGRASATASGC